MKVGCRATGACTKCGNSCQERDDGLCGNCRWDSHHGRKNDYDVGLVDGEWVPDHRGIRRWRPYERSAAS